MNIPEFKCGCNACTAHVGWSGEYHTKQLALLSISFDAFSSSNPDDFDICECTHPTLTAVFEAAKHILWDVERHLEALNKWQDEVLEAAIEAEGGWEAYQARVNEEMAETLRQKELNS
jgi:hypothetical protein